MAISANLLAKGAVGAYRAYSAYNKVRPSYMAAQKYAAGKPKRTLMSSADEGHTITKSSARTKKKKMTAAQKLLKEALPLTRRESTTGFQATLEGCQAYGMGTAIWPQSVCALYAPNVSTAIKRFYVESASQKITFANVTSTPLELEIYLLKCKDDTDLSPVTSIANGLIAKYNSSDQHLQPYANHNESSDFKKSWAILSTKKVVLSPGEVHNYTAYCDINKYYTSSNPSNDVTANVKGITHQVLFRVMGTPVVDVANLISLATSKVIYTMLTEWKYKIPQGPSTNQLLGFQGAKLSTVNLATQRYINQDTGLVTVKAMA